MFSLIKGGTGVFSIIDATIGHGPGWGEMAVAIGYAPWIILTIVDIITSNMSVSNKNKINKKFERFSLKASINNKKSNFGIVYKF